MACELAKQHRRFPGAVPTFERLRENNARQGFVTVEQFAASQRTFRTPQRLARLPYSVGWRKGGVQGLTAANVDLRAAN